MNPLRQILSLGDIFDRTFTVIGKSLIRNLFTGAVFIVPAAFLLAFGLQTYFETISTTMANLPKTQTGIQSQQETETLETQEEDDDSDDPSEAAIKSTQQQPPSTDEAKSIALPILGSLLFAGFAYLIFAGASVSGQALCSYVICKEFNGETFSWSEFFSSSGARILFNSLGQVFLESLVYIGIMVVAFILMVIAALFGTMGILLMVFVVICSGALMLFLKVRWTFTIAAIANEGVGPMQSFVRSTSLVRGNWWRTLGITFLFAFIAMFAISLIVTPVGFFLMWDFYSAYFKSLGVHGTQNPAETMKMLSSLGWGFGIIIALDALLKLLVEPAYKCAMYFDLRARHQEFEPIPETTSPERTSSPETYRPGESQQW